MPALKKTKATLRIHGDDLIPDEVSRLLGAQAENAQTRGEILIGKVTGHRRVARTGVWSVQAQDRSPGDLDAQIDDIFARLSDDPAAWAQLQSRFAMNLFCGLFMGGRNEGEVISAAKLRLLGERGIELQLDIYTPDPDEVKNYVE
ncbi:DUF4279 domain-containing protein [Lysobacter sp. Root690]|uniref:DUF4279 domain-containing protein n=1 Tax=Lysobacter sp. Root690 TaxID=1736588 RepID=UPI0006F444B2|nr:DUF4279 domain-containing protein [Lysobacter sp. Root690]KRB07334.1 hypothetical protein ASD86_13175 [Lysobacter sp. Root690]